LHHCFDYRHECCSRCEKGTSDRNCGITSDLERAVNEFRGGGAGLKPAAWLAELVFRLCVRVRCVSAVCTATAIRRSIMFAARLHCVSTAADRRRLSRVFSREIAKGRRSGEVLLHVADSAVSFQQLFVCVIGFRGSDCTCRT